MLSESIVWFDGIDLGLLMTDDVLLDDDEFDIAVNEHNIELDLHDE